MPQASGVFKQIAYKKETAYGTLPTASGAQLLRRVEGGLNLQKDTYQSNEIRADFQTADMRHGVRRVVGNINGELSPGSYAPLIGSLLKRDFAAVSAISSLSITIAASGSNWTLTRGAGSWLTDGVRVGHVGRLTAGTFNAANLNKNLLVLSMTATVLTVRPLNGVALQAEGPIASATFTLPGKSTYVPLTGHTDDSYSFEEWFADITRSETFSGVKTTRASFDLPPTGMATIALELMGKDHGQTPSGTRYFTSPTAAGSSGVVAAVNGIVSVQGVPSAVLTGLSFEVSANYSGDPVVGSNSISALFAGRVQVSGQFSCYFEDGTIPGYFYDETEISLVVAMSTGNAANSDFLTFCLPRIKVGGADKADVDRGIVRTFPFTALLNSTTSAGLEGTTLLTQDSLA